MNATATALITNGKIVCSRCGGKMHAEHLWHEDNEEVPMFLWRCPTGHITQALPLPMRVAASAARSKPPRL